MVADRREIKKLRARSAQAARLLKAIANQRRLLILCELAGGEAPVGALAEAVGLSQSALSQHLAKLRQQKLLATRKEAQSIFYRISDPKVVKLLGTLKEIYCP